MLRKYLKRCVEEQTSWECLKVSLSLNFILLSELFHIYISFFKKYVKPY